jgi:Flp pilus assembly protein CpaB
MCTFEWKAKAIIEVPMRRIVTAAVLLAVGAAMIGFAYGKTPTDSEYVERNGAAVPGEIVAVAGSDVTIEFSLSQERLRATAHPADGQSFTVGAFVMVSVLRDDPTRIVIQGTTESPPMLATGGLVVGGFIIIAALGLLLMTAVSTPVAGRYPPFRWMQERHGGA